MKHLFRATCVLAALVGTAPAFAQDEDSGKGVYVALNAGVASVNDLNVTYYGPTGTFGGTGARDTIDFSYDLKSAVTFGGTIGYDFGLIRADVEIAYNRNTVSAVTVNKVNGSAVTLTSADRADVCDYLEATSCGGTGNTFTFDGGRARQLSAIGNLWVDLPVGGIVTPYVGGGAGIIGYEVDGEGEARFAWQLGAGVAVKLSPTLSLTADYRHRQGSGVTIDWGGNEGMILDKVKTNSLTAGLRVRF